MDGWVFFKENSVFEGVESSAAFPAKVWDQAQTDEVIPLLFKSFKKKNHCHVIQFQRLTWSVSASRMYYERLSPTKLNFTSIFVKMNKVMRWLRSKLWPPSWPACPVYWVKSVKWFMTYHCNDTNMHTHTHMDKTLSLCLQRVRIKKCHLTSQKHFEHYKWWWDLFMCLLIDADVLDWISFNFLDALTSKSCQFALTVMWNLERTLVWLPSRTKAELLILQAGEPSEKSWGTNTARGRMGGRRRS